MPAPDSSPPDRSPPDRSPPDRSPNRPPEPAAGRYLVLTALLGITGVGAAIAARFILPDEPMAAISPLIVGAIAFLKLVHRVVKPPRTGAEEV